MSSKLDDGYDNIEFEIHTKVDEIVFSWIKATISSSILLVIISCKTTHEALSLLGKEYSPIGKSQIQALRERLRSLRKNYEISMIDYLLQFKSLSNFILSIYRISEY